MSPSGILASGRPTLSQALMQASTLTPMFGLASPISSYAMTVILLYMLSKSPDDINLAK